MGVVMGVGKQRQEEECGGGGDEGETEGEMSYSVNAIHREKKKKAGYKFSSQLFP